MSTASDFEKLKRRAQSQGFRVISRRRGRLQFLSPDQHSIITCAPHSFGAPNHGLENFLSKLKRAGYHEEGSMHQAIVSATPHAPTKLNGHASTPRAKPPARDVVIEYFRDHPGIDIPTQTLRERVAVMRPDLGKNAVHSVLLGLKNSGLILQTRPRWYRVTSNIVLPETSITKRVARETPEAAVAPTPDPIVQAERPEPPAKVETPPASISSLPQATVGPAGDPYIDGQLEELESAFGAALTALDRIAAVVKRSRETLVHLAAVKRSLSAVELPGLAASRT